MTEFEQIFAEAHKAYDQFINDNRQIDFAFRNGKLSEWVHTHPLGDVEGESDTEVGGSEVG